VSVVWWGSLRGWTRPVKTRPALGKPAGLATHGPSGMSEMVWLFLGLEGNVNHGPFPVGKLCQDGETGGSRNTLQKKYVKPRSSGFSPTKMWIFHLWLSYFFSYYLCYKKGIFSVQGLPTATLNWHKSASSAFSYTCDLKLKLYYSCLGREASKNYAIIFPTHFFA